MAGATPRVESDVAVVGSAHVTRPAFDELIAQAAQSFSTEGRSRSGHGGLPDVKGQAVALLVQQAEREREAARDGHQRSGTRRCDNALEADQEAVLRRQRERSISPQLEQQHYGREVRDNVRAHLIYEEVFEAGDEGRQRRGLDVHGYYITHPQLYAAQTRDVRHILVKSKPLAERSTRSSRAGNNAAWCALAKKYSQDPSSKDNCGKLPRLEGSDRAASTRWRSPRRRRSCTRRFTTRSTAGSSSSRSPREAALDDAREAGLGVDQQQLLQQNKNQAMTDWATTLTKSFCSGSKIKYQVGFPP